jgi:ketosteroid isomerase-like protein
MASKAIICAAVLAVSAGFLPAASATPEEDRKAVAALDTEFQAAVKRNDAATIERILHDDMILVLGDGRTANKEDHVRAAREQQIRYEIQDEDPGTQVVRVSGNTAVVTARLWIKGVVKDGQPIERRLWFSDTYVRTPSGWKYFFGQASLPLPEKPAAAP